VSGEDDRVSLADALEEVRWDYDPARRPASPLLPTALYFQDFPWEGAAVEHAEPAAKDPG